jgi:undecaprenyl pyrophosphate synthase
MEAKIMKMAKKLLAVVLTGVMAVSMLTGCASISSRRVADELEGMLKAANDKATVKAVDDDLAKNAVKVAKQDNKDALKVDATLKADVKTELTKNNKLGDSYIWVAYFATKDVNKTVKAQNVAKALITTDAQGAKIDTTKAINAADVKVGEKKGNDIMAGNKFELSMKDFTVGDTDYVMVVVTCKAQVKAAA